MLIEFLLDIRSSLTRSLFCRREGIKRRLSDAPEVTLLERDGALPQGTGHLHAISTRAPEYLIPRSSTHLLRSAAWSAQ